MFPSHFVNFTPKKETNLPTRTTEKNLFFSDFVLLILFIRGLDRLGLILLIALVIFFSGKRSLIGCQRNHITCNTFYTKIIPTHRSLLVFFRAQSSVPCSFYMLYNIEVTV